ncbi:MAG: hypothetical protein K1X82_00290 [Bacteroidia bacterium]|nr:hypothetical protein [Bacteroidia bacterium]
MSYLLLLRRFFPSMVLFFIGWSVAHAQTDSVTNANALIQHNEWLRNRIERELNLRNKAIQENDLKTVYFYFHPFALGTQVFEEFESEHKNYKQDLDSLHLQLRGFEVLGKGKIFFCNKEYQCLLKQRTSFIKSPGGEEVLTDRFLIAISGNGESWKFLPVEERDLPRLKSRFPFLCLESE